MARAKKVTIPLELDADGVRRGAREAVSAVRRMDRDGTRSVRSLDRATDRLNRSFRGAARYALGAVAAYVSIDQARIAVETTQELARTTNNLSESFGLSTKMASAFGAVAKARGIDATSLTMAFKTLSTQVENAKDGTEGSVSAFDKLGVSMGDLKKLNTDQLILEISKGFGKMQGSTQKAAVMSQLLGRGFSRLGFLFRDGKDGLMEYVRMADMAGATMTDLERQKVNRLNTAMLKLKLAQIGLQKSLALALTPAIEAGAAKMLEFTRILNNPKLTAEQKFNRISREIKDAIIKVIPAAVKAIGKAAPEVASAFVKGFSQAPILGKLIVGGLLLNKLGGIAAFFRLGSQSGKAMGRGIAFGAVVGLIAAAPEIQDAANRILKKYLPDWLVDLANKAPNPVFGGLSQNKATDMIKDFRGEFARTTGFVQKNSKKQNEAVEGTGRAARKAANQARDSWRRAYRSNLDNAKQAARGVNNSQDNIADKARSKADQTRSAWSRVKDVFNSVKNAIVGAASSLGSFLSKLGDLPGKVKSALGLARGGQVPGTGSGDKIPALLEPGEFVMNRNAVAAYGVDTMMAMNSSVPRMKVGGILNAGDVRSLETRLAEAELTAGVGDDIQAATKLRDAYKSSAAAIARKLGKRGRGRVKGKKRKELLSQRLSDLQAQKTYTDMVIALQEDQGNAADTGLADNLATQNQLLAQQVQNQNALLNVSQSQYGVLAQALAAAVSGHIGGKVGLGLQTPSVAGRLASY